MTEILVMCLFFLLSLFLLRREGLLEEPILLFTAAAALTLAFGLRWCMLDYETLDYQDFLARWVDFYRHNGGFRGLKTPVGNYNVPYLYFLALFSRTEYPDLYLIKYLSIAFDVLLAWSGMKLVSLVTEKPGARLGAFLGILLLPTVLLNGALWGQCDSIYTALALCAIWCGLSHRPRLSLVLATLSFAFKLQAVFLLPLFFVLLTTGRIKWKQLWIVPFTYVASILPAVAAGRPFFDTLTLYLHQTGSIGSGLNYNSSSLYAFYRGGGDEAVLARLGIIGAILFCVLLLGALTVLRRRCSEKVMLCAFALCAVCLPLLLPHMHDRYFFGADVLSFLLIFLSPALLPVPFLCSFASLLGYHAYLKMRYLLPMRYGATALLFAAAMMLAALVLELRAAPVQTEEKEKLPNPEN